jgi:acyl carrier protein
VIKKYENDGAILNSTHESIEEQVRSLLVAYLAPRWEADPRTRIEVTGATNLTSDLTLDSFQVMEFLMEIEDAMDLAIDMNSLSDVHTVSDLAAVVARRAGI